MAINTKIIHVRTFLCFSLIAVSTANSRRALDVGVYWSQNSNQDSLLDACNSGNYQIVNMVFDISLGKTQTPEINLTHVCNSTICTKFSQEIKSCQDLGIRVLLSIGGGAGKYNLNSTEAVNFALYLWNNFLGGQSNSRPLNDAAFDGVHITNEKLSWDNWSELGDELKKLYEEEKQGKKFSLSAAPQCSSLQDASSHSIPEPGVFDYISVQFFGDNPICQYFPGNPEIFWESWNQWKTFVADQVFVELLPAPLAKGMGYIPPEVFRTQILPELQRSSKFGGVMLASDELDKGYSSKISPKVCGGVGAESQSANDIAMFPMGNSYGGQRGFRNCAGTCVISYNTDLN